MAPTTHMTAEAMRFGYGETQLGNVLVAMSDLGVTAILLGSDRPKLRRELGDAFPDVQLTEDEAGLTEAITNVITVVNAPYGKLDLPLDLCGSALEFAVWGALREIPPGETRTYGALAKTLSVPATAREVGAACAANRLAVAVPCHRVVKSDGSIAGYRWGVHRKRRLINMEGVG
jgi:AraC family transcriptional regulator, regulatory protein of adaptative response / methylated-DNA-[protein]-cysteine methyltransferase